MARRLVGFVGVLVVWLGVAALGPAHASAAGTVTAAVQGLGSVTGDGINCTQSGGDCSESYADTTYQDCDPDRKPPCIEVREPPYVELTAGPDSNGYVFDGFNGCESVSGRVCGITVGDDMGITARFRDAQAPSVSAPSPSSGVRKGTFTISATASDNTAVTRVEFRNGGSVLGSDTSAPYEFQWNSATTSDGAKSLTATAYDAAGNSTTSAASVITVDNTAPALSITTGPDGQTFAPGSTQTWTFAATDSTTAVSAECRIVGVTTPDFGSCSGAAAHAVTGLADGSYVFEARAKDGAGNLSPVVQRMFSIDGTPPETTIEDGPKPRTTKKRARFEFSSTEPPNSTFECNLDGGGFEPCEANETYNVKRGRHRLVVQATDAYGNTDLSPATWKWRRVPRR